MRATPIVSLERIIPAPPARVFAAWLDADALASFMYPAAGSSVVKAEADPRVGGRFLVVMRVGGKDLPHSGEYRVIEPDRRLVFTWHSDVAPAGSEVTLRFEPVGANQTRLSLVHTGLPLTASTAHEAGWTHILATLAGWADAPALP